MAEADAQPTAQLDAESHSDGQSRNTIPDGETSAGHLTAEEVPEEARGADKEADRQAPPPKSEGVSTPKIELPPTEYPNGQPTPDTTEPSAPPTPRTARQRTDSQSTTATTTTQRSSTKNSLVFVVTALEAIAASKDARKTKKLGDSVQQALKSIKEIGDPGRLNPEVLFEPLQLAADALTHTTVIIALDCIGKLISYSYFSVPTEAQANKPEVPPLIERAIDTICDCFQGEATHNDVQLQIVKSLLAAILNDKIVVHGAGLLKAVRLTYNIFLLSKSSANQQVAQGALTQMVGTVFERVKARLALKEGRLNGSRTSLGGLHSEETLEGVVDESVETVDGSRPGTATSENDTNEIEHDIPQPSDRPVEDREQRKMTLQTFEKEMSANDDKIHDNAPTLVTRLKSGKVARLVSGETILPHEGGSDAPTADEEEEDEIYMKDAFLVFRAMCRLSTKGLPVDQALDVKSQGMRSKLLSLHIVHTILHNHVAVFVSPLATLRSGSNDEPTPFVQAVKSYLCLSLSRNGASSVNRVFEISCEIFWLMVKYLRVMLKKEIEVFMKEIYLNILDKRSAALFQKECFLSVLGRMAADPRALVEIYLNYDCDRTALDNMYQRIVEHLSRLASTPVTVTPQQQMLYQEHHAKKANTSDWQTRGTLPPSLATASIHAASELDQGYPPEYAMKQESLEALVEILRSLVNWSQQGIVDSAANMRNGDSRNSVDDLRESMDTRDSGISSRSPAVPSLDTPPRVGTPLAEDDPAQLEKAKQRKTAMVNAMKQFNFKPKRGIKVLLKDGFIKSDNPVDIARFFLGNETVDKKALGEYLGEGEPENIAIMHAFVDLMDFNRTRFVDALRRFLQSFRLPGEAQKIDRFMLKFAERYITGNPNAFANADTAYVLAYSVIMLNTDQHSAKIRGNRMTPEDFIKNNRGINDNADLPDDYLRGIFDEIHRNEIVLETEQEVAENLGMTTQPSQGMVSGISQSLATMGRDLQREAYIQASEQMANKTEQLYKSLLRAQKRGPSRMPITKFIPATSYRHVGPMFEVTWMSFLTALSGFAQETNNLEVVKLCMEGQKLAIRVACLFDIESARQAFVASLARFTYLYNPKEIKQRNVEALKALLEVALQEGNLLKDSWRDILVCISQLDRLQLISTGVDAEVLPDILKAEVKPGAAPARKSLQVPQRPRQRPGFTQHQSEIAEESRSPDVIRSVDRIFTNTANLSGEAIVYFVKALTQVSWQEIQASGTSSEPRTYSLQKLVEISGYNMTRVRFEWTNIWQILGEHFNQVGCHNNTHVVFFALNSLRQLSMRFMEIEELPGFKFQKDFLKPFEHIMSNSTHNHVKDMVLRCLIQMIQGRGENIRSGWRTMFGVFTVAAREPYSNIVDLAFENVTKVYETRFGVVISQGAFADLVVCLTEFSKNHKFQKKSLQAIELLKSSVPKMLRTPECPLSARSGLKQDAPTTGSLPKQPSRQTQEEQFWFPVLFAFHDVLMTGEDLEVRARALKYLFETLIRYGGDFPADFWDTLWRQILYPIFMVLKSKSEMSKVLNHEDLSVWLSTTMIEALRNMISLFTHFFDSLEYMLDRFLDLLALCICQENDTLARIGSNCLQQLILQNVNKFTPEHWGKIVGAFVTLFRETEATALFAAATSSSYHQSTPSATMNGTAPSIQTENQPITDLSMTETPAQEQPDESLEDNALGINGLPPQKQSIASTSDRTSEISQPASPPPPAPLKKSTTDAGLEYFNSGDSSLQQAPVVVTAARRRYFNQIITKCVLQLLMIETVDELFSNEAIYSRIPSAELLRLMGLLKKSYHFAKKFNEDRDLRNRLFREGFMKQPPNLLKQESRSASVYVGILFRMFHDSSPQRAASKSSVEEALIPLCTDIIASYNSLDEETQQRNIVQWRPAVVDVLDGYTSFPKEDFERHVRGFAPLVVGLMGRELGPDLQRSVQAILQKIFEVKLGIPLEEMPLPAPKESVLGGVGSPRGSVSSATRRGSKGR